MKTGSKCGMVLAAKTAQYVECGAKERRREFF
jgi:hypothetical protein